MREVWHKGSVINVHFAIVGSQRKEVRSASSKCPGGGQAGSVSV